MPDKWATVKKLTMQAKLKVAPLQANEATNIRRKSAAFDIEQYKFRELFRKEAPFLYENKDPYRTLEEVKLHYSFILSYKIMDI